MAKAVERIRSQTQTIAHNRRHENEIRERYHRERKKILEERMPLLEGVARHAHEIRFKPLQDILDLLEVESILREYFPESAQIVVDNYDEEYKQSLNHKGNRYYRSIWVAEHTDSEKPKLYGVYVTAIEPPTDPFKTTRTQYSVGIVSYSLNLEYEHEKREKLKKLFTETQKDKPEFITPPESFFTAELSYDLKTGEIRFFGRKSPFKISLDGGNYPIYGGGRDFAKEEIPFDRSPDAIRKVEETFIKVLQDKEYQRLYPR